MEQHLRSSQVDCHRMTNYQYHLEINTRILSIISCTEQLWNNKSGRHNSPGCDVVKGKNIWRKTQIFCFQIWALNDQMAHSNQIDFTAKNGIQKLLWEVWARIAVESKNHHHTKAAHSPTNDTVMLSQTACVHVHKPERGMRLIFSCGSEFKTARVKKFSNWAQEDAFQLSCTHVKVRMNQATARELCCVFFSVRSRTLEVWRQRQQLAANEV